MFKYEKISSYITDGIISGLYPYGSKLPSIRSVSRQFNCAVSVVMQAYEALEIKELIYPVEKSGYYVSPPNTPSPEINPLEKYSYQSEQIRPLSIIDSIVKASRDESIIPLGAGIPDKSILPLTTLKQSITRVLKEGAGVLQNYSEESGLLTLRREIAKIMFYRGIHIDADEILITNGCIDALRLAIESVSHPGDTFIIEQPIFMGTIQLLKELKRNIISIPVSPDTGMDVKRLESVLKEERVQGIILTAAFQNPIGFVMPEENRKMVVELAASYRIPIIEDDLYSDCSHHMTVERPLKSFDDIGNVLYCSSFSKTISPGIRIGWISGGRYHKDCRSLKSITSLGGAPFIQAALADFLKRRGWENHVKKIQRDISRQASELKALLKEHLPNGVKISKPKGGLFYWIELDESVDSVKLFEDCLKSGISIVPGPAFSSGARFRNCIRISFGSPVTESIRDGVKRLGELIKCQHC